MARSVYVYRPGHPAANERGFVDTRDLYEVPAEQAKFAPIMVDRFYEGATTQTMNERNEMVTVDIGTRKRHREYLRQNGLTTADDYTQTWAKAAEQRERVKQGEMPSKTRREALERRMYELYKP